MNSNQTNNFIPALRINFNELYRFLNKTPNGLYNDFRKLLSHLLIEKNQGDNIYHALFNHADDGKELNTFTGFVINKLSIIAIGEKNITFLISCIFNIRKLLADHFNLPNLTFETITNNLTLTRSTKDHPEYYISKSVVIAKKPLQLKRYQAFSEKEKMAYVKDILESRIKFQAESLGLAIPDNLNLTILSISNTIPVAFKKLKNGQPKWFTTVDITFSCQFHMTGPWYLSTFASKGNGYVSFFKKIKDLKPNTDTFINQLENWIED